MRITRMGAAFCGSFALLVLKLMAKLHIFAQETESAHRLFFDF
jgi:hypothetical protein